MRAAALALCLGLAARTAGAASARVELEPGEATVGDRVRATLVVEGAPGELGGAPRFPAWETSWGEAEIVRADPPSEAAGIYRQTLTLAAYRTGEVALPPVEIALPGGGLLRTPAGVALRVRSVLPAGDPEPEPAPPAPARPLPWGERFWWTLAAGLALALAAGAGLFWKRRRERAPHAAELRSRSPLDELLALLGEIEGRAGEVSLERSHTALSLAVRRYLGRALDFPAPESTTSEIQRQLRSRHLPGDLPQRASRLLRECDGVKFARGESTAAELASRLASGREIGRAVDAHLAPPPALEATA
jgi:LPXTG-motif cell wall-anchored protein